MAKRPVHLESATVKFAQLPEKKLIRCDVTDVYFGPAKWSFYVPLSSKDKFGIVPSEIVKSRMLRDFNIKLDQYAAVLSVE